MQKNENLQIFHCLIIENLYVCKLLQSDLLEIQNYKFLENTMMNFYSLHFTIKAGNQ